MAADTQSAVRHAQRHTQDVVRILNINIRNRNAFEKLRLTFRCRKTTGDNNLGRVIIRAETNRDRRGRRRIRRSVRTFPAKARVAVIICYRSKLQRCDIILSDNVINAYRVAIAILQDTVCRIR